MLVAIRTKIEKLLNTKEISKRKVKKQIHREK